MLGAIDLGLITGLMTLGVFLTFKVLNFADLTVDGSFVTGGMVAAMGILAGWSPLLATALGFVAGCLAGVVTGLLNTVGGVNPLLAGILTQTAIYTINLRIGGRSNVSLLNEHTLISWLRPFSSWQSVGVFAAIAVVFWLAITWFLGTDIGLGMRSSGDNETMARAQGVASKGMVVLGLALANGLVALSGALLTQRQGFADISMGIGTIVAGLASVIIGQAIFGSRPVWRGALAAVLGSIVYRLIIQLALGIGLNANDMKLISAVMVILALLLPRLPFFKQFARTRHEREIAKQALAADLARVAKEAGNA